MIVAFSWPLCYQCSLAFFLSYRESLLHSASSHQSLVQRCLFLYCLLEEKSGYLHCLELQMSRNFLAEPLVFACFHNDGLPSPWFSHFTHLVIVKNPKVRSSECRITTAPSPSNFNAFPNFLTHLAFLMSPSWPCPDASSVTFPLLSPKSHAPTKSF